MSKESDDSKIGCGLLAGATMTPGGSAILAGLNRISSESNFSKRDILTLLGFEGLRVLTSVITFINYGPEVAVPLYLGLGAAGTLWVFAQWSESPLE